MSRMQEECRRIMGQIAEAINNAPTGNVISGSEMEVRDLMAQLRQKAFELGVQMRIDSSESTFSPAEGRGGAAQAKQGAGEAQRLDGQRSDQLLQAQVGRRGRRKRVSGGRAGG